MAKNKLSKNFKATPDKNKWATICPPMEYRLISGEMAYELGIVPPGIKDINSVVVGASGSTDDTIMYFANYFRIEKLKLTKNPI